MTAVRPRSLARRLAAAVILIGVGTLLLSACASLIRDRIYQPEPMPADVQGWTGRPPLEVTVTTADGLVLRGYYWPPRTAGGELILFFHGNGGNRYTAARMAEPLARDGGGVLVASYRGYGDNPGVPSETGLFSDGAAFLRLARGLAPASPIYLFGYSLGGAVALETAAREDVAGVVTLGTFAALADLAPPAARGLLPDRYDNRAAIARVTEPILLIHGTADEVVPFAEAESLRRAASGRARLLKLDGAPHRIDFTRLSGLVWDNIRQMPGRPARR